MLDVVKSKNGITIRLADERWAHIIEQHCEMAGLRQEVLEAVAEPEAIYAGSSKELFALKAVEKDKHIVTVYREDVSDGFIITAFLTRRLRAFERRKKLWP